MEQFRGMLNKRKHPIIRNCRNALHVSSTESYGPHLVRSSRRLVQSASTGKRRSAEGVMSSPVCPRPRTTELKAKRSNTKVVSAPAKPRLVTDSWNNIRSSYARIKPTKTLLLRRKFNQEKIVSLSCTNKSVKNSKYGSYGAPKTVANQPPVNGSKPSWK